MCVCVCVCVCVCSCEHLCTCACVRARGVCVCVCARVEEGVAALYARHCPHARTDVRARKTPDFHSACLAVAIHVPPASSLLSTSQSRLNAVPWSPRRPPPRPLRPKLSCEASGRRRPRRGGDELAAVCRLIGVEGCAKCQNPPKHPGILILIKNDATGHDCQRKVPPRRHAASNSESSPSSESSSRAPGPPRPQ